MKNKTSTTAIVISTFVAIILIIASYFLTIEYLSNTRSEVVDISPSKSIENLEDEQIVDGTENEDIDRVSEAPTTATKNNDEKEVRPIIFSHAQYSFIPSDTKELVSSSPYIFIGEVTGRKDNYVVTDNYFIPLFEIRIISNIKGNIESSTIDLIQADIEYYNGTTRVTNGGISWPKDVKEEDILLDIGAVYLFSVYDPKIKNLYGIGMAPYDRELITLDSSLPGDVTIDLAKKNPRVQELIETSHELGVLNPEWR